MAYTPTAVDVASPQNAYETIYQNNNPSVVTIEMVSQGVTGVNDSRFSGQQGGPITPATPCALSSLIQISPTAEGFGLMLDTIGNTVTNNYAIESAAKISVTFSDRTS